MREIRVTPELSIQSNYNYDRDRSNRNDPRYWGRLDPYALSVLGLQESPGREIHFIKGPDNKRISVQLSGDPNGETIYLLHGSPGSRDDQSIDHPFLWHNKLQVVSFDREGCGFSDANPGRTISRNAQVVQSIAEYLGKPAKYIIGGSSGASGAIACSQLEGVERVAALVPFAPFNELGNSWYDGMTGFNVGVFSGLRNFPEDAAKTLDEQAYLIFSIVEGKYDPAGNSNSYRKMRTDRSHREGVRFGPEGWIHDAKSLVSDWGYDPREVPESVETLLWCAEKDIYVGLHHGEWFAENISGSRLHVEPNAQHSKRAEILPEVIRWCLTGEFKPSKYRGGYL